MANEINIDLGKRRSLKANIGVPGYLGKGDTGTGIESITYKGEDEYGGNMYTVLLTDGTSYDITAPKGAKGDKGEKGDKGDTGPQGPKGIKGDTGATGPKGDTGATGAQGPKGDKGDKGDPGTKGDKGADGKSAYAYAVEGGYTGTEAEFAEKLASELLIVAITDNNGTLSADKTYLDIRDAIVAGIPVLVDYNGTVLPLIAMGADFLAFGTVQCANNDAGAIVATEIIEIKQNGKVHDISAYVDIPKTLPNPNALTFTGAVTGTYNGSAPMTVNIPSAVTDAHINSLIDTKLGVIENGSY